MIGSRRDAMEAAVAEAESRGYHVVRLDEPVVGEARHASIAHVQATRVRTAGVGRPACVVSSGETTVHVTGHGKGGRNQEFALAAAEPLAALGVPAVIASVGTDGIDGPTDAAGALVDSTTTCAGAGRRDRRPRRFSRRQQRLRVFRRAWRPHPDRSHRHQRRRPSDHSLRDLTVVTTGHAAIRPNV